MLEDVLSPGHDVHGLLKALIFVQAHIFDDFFQRRHGFLVKRIRLALKKVLLDPLNRVEKLGIGPQIFPLKLEEFLVLIAPHQISMDAGRTDLKLGGNEGPNFHPLDQIRVQF